MVLICTVDNLFQSFKIEDEKLIKYEKKFLEKVNQYYEQQSKNKAGIAQSWKLKVTKFD